MPNAAWLSVVWSWWSEIASVISFLVGPDASYMTGETIHVNGGLYMA